MKKNRKKNGSLNRDGATTTNKDWDFIPVPGKGGKTLNADIPVKKSKDEKKED